MSWGADLIITTFRYGTLSALWAGSWRWPLLLRPTEGFFRLIVGHYAAEVWPSHLPNLRTWGMGAAYGFGANWQDFIRTGRGSRLTRRSSNYPSRTCRCGGSSLAFPFFSFFFFSPPPPLYFGTGWFLMAGEWFLGFLYFFGLRWRTEGQGKKVDRKQHSHRGVIGKATAPG